MKSLIVFRMEHLHLNLTHSRGQSEGHANFLLWISRTRLSTGQVLLLSTHRKSPLGFRLVYLHLTLPILTVTVKANRNSIAKNSVNWVMLHFAVYQYLRCAFLSYASFLIPRTPLLNVAEPLFLLSSRICPIRRHPRKLLARFFPNYNFTLTQIKLTFAAFFSPICRILRPASRPFSSPIRTLR